MRKTMFKMAERIDNQCLLTSRKIQVIIIPIAISRYKILKKNYGQEINSD